MAEIKVLVVDDSIFLRNAIAKMLSSDPEITIIGKAQNGREGFEMTCQLKPDVVTMDIEMPEMTGLEALKHIMEKCPTPVLMLSTLTKDGSDATVEALSNGAVDFIAKTSAFSEVNSLKEILIAKVKEIAQSSVIHNYLKRKQILKENQQKKLENITSGAESGDSKTGKSTGTISKRKYPNGRDIQAVCIGISTGGPAALNKLLPLIPEKFPVPILIAQHMPPHFTKSLSERLNSISKIKVKEAIDGDRILAGTVYLAPGGKQMTVSKRGNITISDEPADELFKPSVNVLVHSAVDYYNKNMLALMMTGMGNDGAEAFKKLHDKGGWIIVQEPDTCVVAGMPGAVIKLNAADEIVPLDELHLSLCKIFNINAV